MSRERPDELIENLGAGLGHRRVEHAAADGLKLGQFTGLTVLGARSALLAALLMIAPNLIPDAATRAAAPIHRLAAACALRSSIADCGARTPTGSLRRDGSGNHPSLWWFFNKAKRLWLFQAQNAQRSFRAVSLRNVGTSGRTRSVTATVHLVVQVL